jgi:two-component system sensor histidine kinase CpxA
MVTGERRLLSDISHELRSPLARLTVAAGIARRKGPESVWPMLDRIDVEAERLDDLIGKLLKLARLQQTSQQLEREPVDMTALVEGVAADAEFEAKPRGRSVTVQAEPGCRVEGDAELLRSAIENVARNAVRYTPEGSGVEIALGRRREEGEEYAVVSVRDRGPGVPDESLAKLFRPFYRVAEARDRQSGGVGLGLAITERVVSAHGGFARAANAPGGGLLVELFVPAA